VSKVYTTLRERLSSILENSRLWQAQHCLCEGSVRCVESDSRGRSVGWLVSELSKVRISPFLEREATLKGFGTEGMGFSLVEEAPAKFT